jgi:hypothetical protein
MCNNYSVLEIWRDIALNHCLSSLFNIFLCMLWGHVIKLKQSHYTLRRRLGERMYSSYSFSTSALDGGEWSASRPGRALVPGKWPPLPIRQEAGWAPELVWTQRIEEKSFRLCRDSNFDRPVVQPLAWSYADWASRLPRTCYTLLKPETSTLQQNEALSLDAVAAVLDAL